MQVTSWWLRPIMTPAKQRPWLYSHTWLRKVLRCPSQNSSSARTLSATLRPCTFLSKSLDSVAQGLPACLRAVAACDLMVTDAEKIVLSHPLILHTSHQAAELFALTRACVLAEDADVTIYTDSRYAFRVAHDFGLIWQSRGFTAANGKPISHASLVKDLITACHLPRSVAIVKTRAHSSGDTDEVRGSSLADRMAKQAAASRTLPQTYLQPWFLLTP
ncbi:uncharacterized protein LOC113637232 [Tachysurus fulvidraco]|uniref:uncharacterized protein LOC113637232 n=1 Tax=Tachysurus fulvidraco TaxID=1234273 RepID=UPI001FED547B|nr:uncharacterized protein LOC113637232 [Tachysurus fulvidraco]XP_047659362.1 uncharacterized protein LOC113637232 [Tachysurus fulvidraco]XP_047659363.1 uncharacterized protein LOC113637232 [Tachysurus fulvidraco]XP_047659364.1 uncharacterized protein LOC113637232 [Tachysurus fulvidraco]XP_047659365.1 uncharacterized protein LOC113637232 [Tachysurus fulvidraco]